MSTLDLAPGPVLQRAADIIHREGHATGDFTPDTGGYCTAAAIAEAAGINPDDWYDDHTGRPVDTDYDDPHEYETDLREWKNGRRASLAALRTFIAHIDPDSRPEEMPRSQLIEHASNWNDDDGRTQTQVVTELRAAAAEAQP